MLQMPLRSSRRMNFFNNFMLTDPPSFNDTANDIYGLYEHWKLFQPAREQYKCKYYQPDSYRNSDSGKVTTVNKSYTFNGDTSIVSDSVSFVLTVPDESGKMKIVKSDR